MFSSCAPCSALVDGVKSGAGNLSDSRRPSGIGIPCTVRDFLYSAHAEPEKTFSSADPSFVMLILTRDIPPYDRLEGYDLCLPDEDGAALQLFPVLVHFLRHLLDPRSHDMIWDDMFKLVKPEEREFREDSAFVWDPLAIRVRLGRYERGEAITFFRMTSYADMRSDATKRR